LLIKPSFNPPIKRKLICYYTNHIEKGVLGEPHSTNGEEEEKEETCIIDILVTNPIMKIYVEWIKS